MPIYENFPSKENVATISQDGLMSKGDKSKLDGVDENANNYIHPNDENTRHVTDVEKAQWSDNTVYSNDIATVTDLGGISAGSTFDNVPLNQLITQLLYPYIPPVVSCSATPNGGMYEKGTSVDVSKITVSVTKKSENITKVEIFDGTTSLGSKEDGSTGSLVFPLDSVSVSANKSFTAKVTDARGSTVSANSGTFTFVYPYYQGVIAATDEPTEDMVKVMTKLIQSKGNKSLNYTLSNQKMVFAYPKSYGALSKIVDPNQFDVTATWTVKEINITTTDTVSTPYYVYTSKPVTVDNYRMQFNY